MGKGRTQRFILVRMFNVFSLLVFTANMRKLDSVRPTTEGNV
nr:MAG TPA: hypothetical protein [Caudoviricetes sp.]